MTALNIDHLRLDVPGLSEPMARELAHLVATGLAAASGLPDATNIPAIRLDLTIGEAADVSALATQIITAALRAIGHATAGTP